MNEGDTNKQIVMRTIILIKALCGYVCLSVRHRVQTRPSRNSTQAFLFLKRLRAAEATQLSNAKPLVFYLGLNYSSRKRPPPPRGEWILDSTLPFRQGNCGTAVHSTWEAVLGPGAGCAPNDIIHFSGPPGTRLWWFTIYSHVLLCGILLYWFQLFRAAWSTAPSAANGQWRQILDAPVPNTCAAV